MSDRDFWAEVYRGLGHILKGFGAISAAIAKRYAFGTRETQSLPDRR